MKLGAHMSIAGGVANALRRGADVGCETVQIFTKNNNRWQGKPITDGERADFLALRARTGIAPVFAHTAYLINPAAPDPVVHERSLVALRDEVERCEALELSCLVLHPGAHKGEGEAAGLARIARSLERVHAETPGARVKILLETTAGQGTSLGHTFDQLRRIMAGVSRPERLGVCLDSCHVFAAGYDIRRRDGYEAMMDEFDSLIGLEHLRAVHLNDSRRECGSRVDRHDHIGQGVMGLDPFRFLVNDQRLRNVPGVLETPKNETCDEDRLNLKTLRELIDG